MKNSKNNDSIQFASIIAHQLKTPVSSAVSLLWNLLGEFAGPLSPKQRELLEKAMARCDESLVAAQRLLTIARVLDQPDSFNDIIDIQSIMHQSIQHFSHQAQEHQIDLALPPATQSAYVMGQQDAFLEVFDALIENAFKYTPDRGSIQIHIDHNAEKQSVIISIADSGVGIPEKDRSRVFEPFYRAPAVQQSARPGTGLGLAFVKTVIEAAKGSIAVSQADLGGAQFTLTFPAAQMPAIDLAARSPKTAAMKVVIVGGVAAGPKVAAKTMRLMPHADVTIVDRGKLLSYAGCGLPYYISGVVTDQQKLTSSPCGTVRDLVFFQNVKNIHVLNQTQAVEIDREQKRIRVRELISNRHSWLDYDKLVLATGAESIIPQIEGVHLENIYTLHGVRDAEGIKSALASGKARDVVIIGAGLIGIEITEALTQRGCRVTILENRAQILRMLDWEIAKKLEHHLESHGVRVLTSTVIQAFEGTDSVTAVKTDKGHFPANLVVMAIGIRPNVDLAKLAGLEIGITGAIKVDQHMQTSDPDIYAAGDCTESINLVTGQPAYIPLGSTANKQGRIVAVNICGGNDTFPGIVQTVACKVFDYSVARTGLTEADAGGQKFDVVTALAPAPDREHFIPGAKTLFLKIIADAQTRRLLGAQCVGLGNAVKRIDVAAVALANRMTIDQIANADLCYAPPFSPVIDNIITAANVARNKLDGHLVGISPLEIHRKIQNGDNDFILLDVRSPREIARYRLPQAVHIPLGSLRQRMAELPPDKMIVTFCNYSLRGYEASVILRAAGFPNVAVLDGGLDMWPYDLIRTTAAESDDDIFF